MSDALTVWAVIALLVAVNGVFVAAEFAILTAPRSSISRLASGGSRAASLVLYIQNDQRRQDRYIATAQLGITAASLGLGMYGEHKIADWLSPWLAGLGWFQEAAAHSAAAILAVLLITYLHIVLGEMVPKSLALFRPEKTAMAVSTPMLQASRIGYPLIAALNGVGNLILLLLRVPLVTDSTHIRTPQELEMIVEESHESGVLGEQESELIVNLLHFSDIPVRKVMVPRTSVIGIPVNSDVQSAVQIAVQARHTRYPVYGDSLDDIRGILHVKELCRELRQAPEQQALSRAMRRPVFVPEQLTVEGLLLEFQRAGSQIAVVIDEYGGTSGIVTLEDVLEEIFGEVQDEFDEEEDEVVRFGDRAAVVAGMLRLDEFAEEFGVDLSREGIDTVGGLVMAELGHPPSVGDTVTVEGITMRVLRLERLAVARVRVDLPDSGTGILSDI